MPQAAYTTQTHEEVLPGDAVAGAEKQPDRLLSLDALRGFDMFWIISGEGIFHSIAAVIKQKYSLQQNTVDWQIGPTKDLPFVERLFVTISNQLHHSPWNGFTFYDLIFPLFIFIAGVSMPFSYGKKLSAEATGNKRVRRNIYRSLIKRTLLLIFFGAVVNGLFKWQGYDQTRIASVLGRIGLACFFAALIYLNASRRAQIVWAAGLLLGYWAAMMWLPVPGFGAGVLTPEGNLAAYVDRILLPGKLHRTVYDPEGLLSTVPSVVTALLGVFTGEFLKNKTTPFGAAQKGFLLSAAGIVLLGLGLLWNLAFPINKTMWTSSFVLYAGGWSLLLFALFYWVIDVAGYKTWSKPFVWIGANSILIYLMAHGGVDFYYTANFLFAGAIKYAMPLWQAVWLAMAVAAVQIAMLWVMFKKKLFLKL